MKKRLIALALCLVMLATCLGAGVDVLSGDLVPDEVPTVTEVPDAEPVPTNAVAEPVPTDTVAEPVPTATAAEPDSTLYDKLMACERSDEFEAIAEAAGDEQISALTETELAALEAHYADIYVGVIPETVVFTDAGPFMPAVNVSSTARFRMMRAAAANTADTQDDSLVSSKTATKTDEGYKITIEAYATGTVTTTTSTEPVDIVLVLDQSGSMAYDFDGNSTSTNSDRRQYAMKQAVNNFITEVNSKYDAEKSDHRMAIVTFGSSASTLQGWTVVNEAGKTALQGKISGLPDSPAGATNVAAGMTQAEKLMGSGYSYTGTNTQRQKVVIVFTDGVPTTQTNFNVDVANAAITTAKTMKDNAGVTIYSVGIFNGADPNKIHGDYYYRAVIADTPCDGSVGSYWGTTNLSSSNANDFADPDIPAGNRFLNYISNNYDASNIGLSFNDGDGLFGGYQWKITQNFTRTADNYYLTADNSASLNTIFQTISNNVGSTSVTLDSKAVVRDVVTKYFDMPADTSDISVKTYNCTGKNGDTFAFSTDGEPLTGAVTIDKENNTIDVSGFDFQANYVRDKATNDGYGLGKKLVIEFTVTPKAEFWGGNQVPTNGDTSGIYGNKDSTEAVRVFDVPTVDVPINAPDINAVDKNIYLLGTTPTADQLYEFETPATEPWQTEFVDITVNKDKDINNTADGEYSITVTVSPKYEGPETPVTKSASAKVNVFKPEITFKDSAIDLGQTPNYAEDNLVSVVWKHNNVEADTSAMGRPPELTYTYEYDPDAAFRADTTVEVTEVLLNNVDVRNHAAFIFGDCDYNNCAYHGDWKFVVHIKTFDLTITKSITNYESKLYGSQDFVFNVKCEDKNIDIDVVVNVPDEETRGSVTIKGLPVGTYTITENTGWSWRYELQGVVKADGATGTLDYEIGSSSATYTPNGINNQIIFTNNWVQAKWLSFTDSVKNIFGKPNT